MYSLHGPRTTGHALLEKSGALGCTTEKAGGGDGRCREVLMRAHEGVI